MTQRSLNEPVTDPLNDEELAALNAANTGFGQHIGMVITYCSAERLECYVEVKPEHLQVAGIVNGGVYAAIGETLGSAAAIVTSGRPAVGMSNNTDFLRSVSSGRIEAVARPVHIGRSTHLWRVEMTHEGKLVAITTLKLMMMEL